MSNEETPHDSSHRYRTYRIVSGEEFENRIESGIMDDSVMTDPSEAQYPTNTELRPEPPADKGTQGG